MPGQAQQSPSCLALSHSRRPQAGPAPEDSWLWNIVTPCSFHLGTFAHATPALWHSPSLFTGPLEAAPWAPMTYTAPGTLRSRHPHFNTLIELSAYCLSPQVYSQLQASRSSLCSSLKSLLCQTQSEHSDSYQRNASKVCGQCNECKLFKTQYSGSTITFRNRLTAAEGPSLWSPLEVHLRRSGPEGSSKRCTCS